MVGLSGPAEVLNFPQLWEKIVRKKITSDVYFRNIIVVEGGEDWAIRGRCTTMGFITKKNWPRNDEGRGQGVGCKGVGLREI